MKKSLTLVLGTFVLSHPAHFSLAKEIPSSETDNEWLSVTDDPEAIAEAQVDAKLQSRKGFVQAYQGLWNFDMSGLDYLRFGRNREWIPWLKMQSTLHEVSFGYQCALRGSSPSAQYQSPKLAGTKCGQFCGLRDISW